MILIVYYWYTSILVAIPVYHVYIHIFYFLFSYNRTVLLLPENSPTASLVCRFLHPLFLLSGYVRAHLRLFFKGSGKDHHAKQKRGAPRR
jgi:hypothetical protein